MKSFRQVLAETGHTDKDTSHNYGHWYDQWFEPYRTMPVSVLEIGVCVFGGGGALSLAEYFQNGVIWAVDIDKRQCIADVFSHPRIKFFEQDAYHADLLKLFDGVKFDIIIDDASHEVNDQLKLVNMLRPYLSDDGFYVIEDCCTCHWLPYLKNLWNLNLKHTLIDMSTATVYDNTLIRLDPK